MIKLNICLMCIFLFKKYVFQNEIYNQCCLNKKKNLLTYCLCDNCFPSCVALISTW